MLVARDLWVSPPGEDAAPVVRGASLEVRRGEWLAVTGPNGGGKTTLLLALAGLWPAQRGAVELDGRPLSPDARDDAARPGVVMQDLPSQLLQPTVAEEIGFGPRNLGWDDARVGSAVEAWMRRFGLEPMAARDPRTLPAGLQQVTLLAAALATGPQALLVDEGGAHLDPVTRRRVLDVLREEVAGGLALVWVTQEPEEIAAAHRAMTIGGSVNGIPHGPIAAAAPAGPVPALATIALRRGGDDETGGARIAIGADWTFDLPSRGVTVVQGRNGSGKSTLLSALAGVLESPQVSVAWRSPRHDPPILSAQHPDEQIFAEIVEEEVMFAAIQRGRPEEEARSLVVSHFEALGLGGGFLKRRTWGISLGEKRLVQAVAAIVAPASVVLLDEPTSGLDRLRRSALGRIVSATSLDVPVVVAGHDPGWLGTPPESRIKLGSELASPSKKTD